MLVCSLQKLQWFTTDGKLVYIVQGNVKEVENDIGSPDNIALGRSGHIYVLDGKHKKVHVLNGDATYIRCFGFHHLTSMNYHPPKALVVNSDENFTLLMIEITVFTCFLLVVSISSNLVTVAQYVRERYPELSCRHSW